jgi:hypothetical protein
MFYSELTGVIWGRSGFDEHRSREPLRHSNTRFWQDFWRPYSALGDKVMQVENQYDKGGL